MAAKSPSGIGQTEIYYHALYHHVAHWAAYVAMMGVLVTIGLVLSLSPTSNSGVRAAGVGAAILFSLLGAGYFIKGMDTYGSIINRQLPPDYLSETQTVGHKAMIGMGVFAALLCGVWDFYLLFMLMR